ncbi:MAG TPA: ADOP family duplicated permease, partial [Vicinamibacterales bacterium]|nr:ADOP family duplicated permease [Vicinamibacterales bacterium]
IAMFEPLIQDIRFGLRLLKRHRAFSVVAIGTLAIGIGAATALFSVVHAAVLRPLPYAHPEQLVDVTVTYQRPDASQGRIAPSMVDVRSWRESRRVFQQIAVDRGADELIVETPEPQRLRVKSVSEGYLETFGLAPMIGRSFSQHDAGASSALVVLLGNAYWRENFGGDPAVVGRSIRVAGTPATIVGVMARGVYPEIEIWQPYRRPADQESRRGSGASVIGRLQAGLDIAYAERQLTALVAPDPIRPGPSSARLRSLYDQAISGTGTTITTFVSAVVAILLIACVNVAGLLLARGTMRIPELAVRRSIGAGRGRIVRQLLTESIVLGVAGGIAGISIAWLSVDALVAVMPLELPETASAALNGEVLAFAVGLSLFIAAAAGVLPAWRLSGASVQQAIASAGRRHGPALSRRGGQALIAVEIALAVVLLAGAVLMIRSFGKLLSTDVGFDASQVVAMEVEPVDPNPAAMQAYYPALVGTLRQRLGGIKVGAANQWPFGGRLEVSFLQEPKWNESIEVRAILPGFFEVLGLTPTMGRFPTDADLESRRPVAIINEAARKALFDDRSPVGRQLIFSGGRRPPLEVIGVVPDLRHEGPLWEADPALYLMNSSIHLEVMTIFVRAPEVTPALATMLRDTALAIGPPVIVDRIADGETYLLDRIRRPRSRTWLLSLLGGIGLLLALVGVFSVTAYAVARRTQEIGVRMAFGARPNDVVRTMLSDAVVPVVAGLAIGLAGSYYATAVIQSFLFQTTPHDPGALAAAAITLGATALIAAWIPARRAARVDPVLALRAD